MGVEKKRRGENTLGQEFAFQIRHQVEGQYPTLVF
jgi:hypothetical protein